MGSSSGSDSESKKIRRDRSRLAVVDFDWEDELEDEVGRRLPSSCMRVFNRTFCSWRQR